MVSARIEKKLIPLPRLLLGPLRSPFFFFFFFANADFFSFLPQCGTWFWNKERGTKSKTARKVGRVKERGGVGKSFSFPSPSPLFHFFALAPFFARPTSKSRSSVFFCSELKRKCLLRRLPNFRRRRLHRGVFSNI